MKIEIGESVFYSWLRHVKECQVVQTNWKVSSQWKLENFEEVEELIKLVENNFESKYGYKIFKKNTSVNQIIKQGECDALGFVMKNNGIEVYAADVAFHENGLNYGSKEETIMKVIAKSVRTASILWGFLGIKKGEIIFASPKIPIPVLEQLSICFNDINAIFTKHKFDFKFRIIANDNFNSDIIQPLLMFSDEISDTSELFIRSYQLYTMFNKISKQEVCDNQVVHHKEYEKLKIGIIANEVLRDLLQTNALTNDEVERLQSKEYSKKIFNINYALLVNVNSNYDKVRYYSNSILINGQTYLLCSQWFERNKPYLIKWLDEINKQNNVNKSVDIYKELKIGRLANKVLRDILEKDNLSDNEIKFLQEKGYSKRTFDLQYPLLVKENADYDKVRYYIDPINIRNEKYMLCSQWYETASNNDRPYLIKWIESHSIK